MENQIIVIKPKSLSSKDKAKLTKAGNIVIEAKNENDIYFPKQGEVLKLSHLNCCSCGERIYLLQERIDALKNGDEYFHCSRGHSQAFDKKK